MDELTDFLKDMKVVWVVMSDTPSRGGDLYTVVETIQEAFTAALELAGWRDAVTYPIALGSRPFDEMHTRVSRGRGVILYDLVNKSEVEKPSVDTLVHRYETLVGLNLGGETRKGEW